MTMRCSDCGAPLRLEDRLPGQAHGLHDRCADCARDWSPSPVAAAPPSPGLRFSLGAAAVGPPPPRLPEVVASSAPPASAGDVEVPRFLLAAPAEAAVSTVPLEEAPAERSRRRWPRGIRLVIGSTGGRGRRPVATRRPALPPPEPELPPPGPPIPELVLTPRHPEPRPAVARAELPPAPAVARTEPPPAPAATRDEAPSAPAPPASFVDFADLVPLPEPPAPPQRPLPEAPRRRPLPDALPRRPDPQPPLGRPVLSARPSATLRPASVAGTAAAAAVPRRPPGATAPASPARQPAVVRVPRPPVGPALADALRGTGAALALAAGVVGLLAVAWLAPPFAGLAAAGAALALLRRDAAHDDHPAATLLGWSGFVLGSLAALTGAVAEGGLARGLASSAELALPGAPLAWPGAWLLAGGALGLAASGLAGARGGAREGAALASASALVGLLAALAAFANRPATLALGGALLASTPVLVRTSTLGSRHVELRRAFLGWSVAGAVLASAAVLLAVAEARPLPPWAIGPSLVVLGLAALRVGLERQADEAGDWPRRWAFLAAAGGAWLGTLEVAGHGGGGAAATSVAGLVVPVASGLVLAWTALPDGRRADAAWALRCVAGAGAVTAGATIGVVALENGLHAALPWLAGALLAACLHLGCERRLGATVAAETAALACGIAAACAALGAAGVPLTWLPAVAVLLAAAVAAIGVRTGRHALGHWEGPGLALTALAACVSLVEAARGGWIAGTAGALLAALAPFALRALPAARAVHPALVAAVPAALCAGLAGPRWMPVVLAVSALAAWPLSRRHAEMLASVGLLALAALASLPALLPSGAWLPAALTVGALGLLAAQESWLARSQRGRGTHALASAMAGAAPLGAAALIAAGLAGSSLPVALLAAAVVVQALDLAVEDGRLARALRASALVGWLAGVALTVLQAAEDVSRGAALLGAAAVAAALLGVLRRERWPWLVAGLLAATATGCVSTASGLAWSSHPSLFLVPAAAWVTAWGVFESLHGRRAGAFLALGLAGLLGAMLAEAHVADATAQPLLRIVSAAFALTLVLAGALVRYRVPVLAGLAGLAIEGAFLVADGAALARERPLEAGVAAGATVLVLGALAARLLWRAGGVAAFGMAWAGDLARLREAWSRWT